MLVEEALLAARKRHRVRVFDARSPYCGKTGKISELLGERFYYRGEPRAWIELESEDSTVRGYIIVPLAHLEKADVADVS